MCNLEIDILQLSNETLISRILTRVEIAVGFRIKLVQIIVYPVQLMSKCRKKAGSK